MRPRVLETREISINLPQLISGAARSAVGSCATLQQLTTSALVECPRDWLVAVHLPGERLPTRGVRDHSRF